MIVYIIMYSFILICPCIIRNYQAYIKKRENRIAIIIFGLITLILALRHPSMGVDLQYKQSFGYLWSFKMISQYSFKELRSLNGWLNYEWGYIFYNKLLSLVSTDDQWLLIASAILSIVPVGVIVRKYSKDYAFSAIVYLALPCFLVPFSALRQAIAIGICCLASVYIVQEKPKPFIILVILAWLFHYSAVIFLVAYPLFHWHLPKKERIWTLLALPIVFIARYPTFLIASKIFKHDAKIDDNGAINLLIVLVLIYSFCAFYLNNDDMQTAGFLNIFYFACICQCFGGLYTEALRVGFYFMPALSVVLPNVICNIKDSKSRSIFHFVLIYIFTLYGLTSLYHGSWAESYPYYFFWNEI